MEATQAQIPVKGGEQQGTLLPGGAEIEVRKMDFSAIENSPKYHMGGEPVLSHFVYVLSLLFPEGELFFMDSVRNFRDQITDPVLKKQVRGFLGQEALHTKEHVLYNKRIDELGLHVSKFDNFLKWLLNIPRRFTPKLHQLAITAALEHFTAIMADKLLTEKDVQDTFDPAHRELWLWHAIEETEHKAVAFDVYRAVGGGEIRRMIVMLVVSIFFIGVISGSLVYTLARDGQLFNIKSWWHFAKWLLFKPGLAVQLAPTWADYFKWGFHPWQHDNHELIESWKARHAGQYAVA